MIELTRPVFDQHELDLLKSCLDSCWVTQGPLTQKFEALIAAEHEVRHALATTSCTAALHLATMAMELEPGDEVIVPAFTWVTSAHCAEYVGAKAVFADVDLDTFNLSPAALEAAITRRTRAIVAVHLFGLPADMDPILAIARRHNLRIIEDAACAIATRYHGRPVGSIGDIGCFSFHPRKIITTGEGGAVTTNDDALADRVRALRNHGATGFLDPQPQRPMPWHMSSFNVLGYNLRLSDIQAAVGVAQWDRLEGLVNDRRRLADRYNDLLKGVAGVVTPKVPDGCTHTYQSYVIRLLEGGVERRNRAMTHMASQAIQTRPGTHAVHRLGYYVNKYGLHADQFPNAVLGEDTTITLPLFPGMSQSQQDLVVEQLKIGLGQ